LNCRKNKNNLVAQLTRQEVFSPNEHWNQGVSKKDVFDYIIKKNIKSQIDHYNTGKIKSTEEGEPQYERKLTLNLDSAMEKVWEYYGKITVADEINIVPNLNGANGTDPKRMSNILRLLNKIASSLNESLQSIQYGGAPRQADYWYHSMSPAEYEHVRDKLNDKDIGTAYKDYDLWLGNWVPYVAGFTNSVDEDPKADRIVYRVKIPRERLKNLKAHAQSGMQANIHNQINVQQEGLWKGSTNSQSIASELNQSLNQGIPEPMNIGIGKNIVKETLKGAEWTLLTQEEVGEAQKVYIAQKKVKKYLSEIHN